MTNWFQTQEAKNLFERYIHIEQDVVSCLGQVLGWGPSKRAIIQGGPQVPSFTSHSAQTLHDVMVRFRKEAEQQHCVYAEIRCFDDYSAYRNVLEQAGWRYQPHYDVLIRIDAEWRSRMQDVKRQQVRKARREGQSWRVAKSEEDVRSFYCCLKSLYRTKVHRPLPSLPFFIKAWRQGIVMLVVEKKGEIIGGALMPVLDMIAYEWYKCGGVMATYGILEWCEQHGIDVLDAMGAGEPGVPYGVRDFKLSMGGELKEWGRYICVLKPWVYKIGCKWIKKMS